MLLLPSHRRMFPGLCVSVWGLEADVRYTIQVEMVPAGKSRFKYINSKWVPVGKADSHEACSLVHTHPDSPASGKQWMKDRVAFKKIKLTNDKSSKKGYVRLHPHTQHQTIHIMHPTTQALLACLYSILSCSYLVSRHSSDHILQTPLHSTFLHALNCCCCQLVC